jgi:hypothetical protein
MHRQYPYRQGKDADHDNFGRRVPPLPKNPYATARRQYERGTILSLMARDQSLRGRRSERQADKSDVKFEITRTVEVCHSPIAGSQKAIGRVIEGPETLLHKELFALIYDPLYVGIEDLRIDYQSMSILVTSAESLESDCGQTPMRPQSPEFSNGDNEMQINVPARASAESRVSTSKEFRQTAQAEDNPPNPAFQSSNLQTQALKTCSGSMVLGSTVDFMNGNIHSHVSTLKFLS